MKPQSATSLPPSADADRKARMIRYSIAMAIRLICFALCLVAQGWWLVLCALGAIVLPYFAVVMANVGTAPATALPLRPGGLVPYRAGTATSPGHGPEQGAADRSDDADDGGPR